MTPTTEALPILQPAQQPAIVTGYCANGGWIACLSSDPSKWQWGPSEAEAVFFLVLEHQDIFGTIQRQGEWHDE